MQFVIKGSCLRQLAERNGNKLPFSGWVNVIQDQSSFNSTVLLVMGSKGVGF
jgi:hypothetical protein